MSALVEPQRLQQDETRSIRARGRGLTFDLDRLLDAAVIEPSIQAQRAKTGVAQNADLARVLDDRDELRPKPSRARAHRQRRGEGRSVSGECTRRLVEPVREEERHVRLARHVQRLAAVLTAERAQGAAALVLDQTAEHHIRPRRDVDLEPVAGARAGEVRAGFALRDDAFERILGDDIQERLAVPIEVVGHAHGAPPQLEIAETAPALCPGTREERPPFLVKQVEGDKYRTKAAFRGAWPEPAGEQVVGGPATGVAYDDLAVDDRALGYGQLRQLGKQWEEIAAVAVGHAQHSSIARRERTK